MRERAIGQVRGLLDFHTLSDLWRLAMASYSLIELSPNRRQLATLELVDFGIKRHRSAARISVPNISSRAARQFRMAMRTHAAACAVRSRAAFQFQASSSES